MRQPLHLEETIALKSKQVIYHTAVVMHVQLSFHRILLHQVEMLENHNRMLVELLSKQHPLTSDKLQSLMKVKLK